MSSALNGVKICENLFFGVTCVSVFTCVVRSDYNFAMGLLCYYMIKNVGEKVSAEIAKTARTVSYYSTRGLVLTRQGWTAQSSEEREIP